MDTTYCTDLSAHLGYPLRLEINGSNNAKPFFWRSFEGNELLIESSFLQTPGLPLTTLIPEEQLSHISEIVLHLMK